MTPDSPTAPRKPYVPPTLDVYGDLTLYTHAVGNMSLHADGGSMSMQKTQ